MFLTLLRISLRSFQFPGNNWCYNERLLTRYSFFGNEAILVFLRPYIHLQTLLIRVLSTIRPTILERGISSVDLIDSLTENLVSFIICEVWVIYIAIFLIENWLGI